MVAERNLDRPAPAGADRGDRGPGGRRRGDAQLAPQPFREDPRRVEGRRAVAGGGQQADQLQVRALREGIEVDAATGPAGRRRQVPLRLGPLRQGGGEVGERVEVLRARTDDPIGVDAGEELARAQGERTIQVPRRPRRAELTQIDAHVFVAQADAVPRRRDGALAGRAQRASQLVERVTKRLSRAFLGDVRAQPPASAERVWSPGLIARYASSSRARASAGSSAAPPLTTALRPPTTRTSSTRRD